MSDEKQPKEKESREKESKVQNKGEEQKKQPKEHTKEHAKEHSKEYTKEHPKEKQAPGQQAVQKKKLWYTIVAPKLFDNAVLGETYVYEPDSMKGKTITQSLMNLTNDVKKQSVNISFEVESIENKKAKTKIISYHIIPSTVKRFVRKGSMKVDLSFRCKTKDSVPLKIKSLMVTRTKTKRSILAKLSHSMVEFVTKKISSETYDETIDDLVSYNLQKSLRDELKKIYPLKTCEIRFAGVDKSAGKQAN